MSQGKRTKGGHQGGPLKRPSAPLHWSRPRARAAAPSPTRPSSSPPCKPPLACTLALALAPFSLTPLLIISTILGSTATAAAALLALVPPAAAPPPAAAGEIAESKKIRKTIKKEFLNSFQKSAIRAEIVARADAALGAALTSADAPAAVRLLLADAAGFDPATKTGGVDGSAALFEAGTPAVKALAPYLAKLKAAKAAIDKDARPGQAPISWADLEVLAARAALGKAFKEAKLAAGGNPASIAAMKSDFPVLVGRVDAASGPAAKGAGAASLPAAGADADAIIAFFGRLGAKPDGSPAGGGRGLFWERPAFLAWSASLPADVAAAEEARLAAANPEFREAKARADRSRGTASRSDYEVDIADVLLRLASSKAGATFDPDAYLYDIVVESVKLS